MYVFPRFSPDVQENQPDFVISILTPTPRPGRTYGDKLEAPGTTFSHFPYTHAHSPESLSPHLSEVRGENNSQTPAGLSGREITYQSRQA